MKHSDSFLKAVSIVLCGVVALYIILSVVFSSKESYTVYKAIRYEVGDGITTSGFVVRDEEVLTSDQKIVVLERGEGERVGAGQSVAVSYTSEGARQRQTQIRAMEAELAQMEYAYGYSGNENDGSALDADIVSSIQQLNVCVSRQDYGAAGTEAEQLKSFVLRRYITAADAEKLWQRILATRDRLEALRAEAGGEASHITVDQAGYFSGSVDGYESLLDAEYLKTAAVADLEALPSQGAAVPANAIGKLITSPRWYYVAVVDADALKDCKEGDYLSVQFSYDFYDAIRMRVQRIGKNEDGKCVLVLTTDRFLQSAVSARRQTAELVFADKSGLRVPKTAIYVVDGVSGVYVLTGIRAVFKPVEIIYDNGDYFIVREDKSSTDNLWPDDEIILTTEELFDGKVMQQ